MAKILIIDDDRSIHLALGAILHKAGHECISAMDGMQAMMVAQREKPALIVLDVNMPAGGGAAVFERLNNMAHTAMIPILIYSALTQDQIVAKIPGSAHAKVPALIKPATPEAILQAVRSLLPNP